MNAKTLRCSLTFAIAAAIALSVTGTASARQRVNAAATQATVRPADAVALLSRATGLTAQQVKLELGKQNYWADNILTYDFADGRFRKMVGYQVYYDLKTRDALTSQDVQHLTAMAAKRQAEQVAIAH